MATTVILARLSAVISLYFAFVAPGIATPLRYHCHTTVTGFGFQVFTFAFNVLPTFAVPEIVGLWTVVNFFAAATTTVNALEPTPPSLLAATVNK